jgi:two-component system response regulator YesN
MDRARELLANEDLKTYEVAQSVGFSDPHYFSLTFKKQTGLSPTEFRNSVRDAS